MVPRAILVSACLCAFAVALPGASFGSHIYFDADADLAPDLAPVLAKVVKGDGTLPEEASPFDDLTPRESEILCLLAEGQSNKVIARNLGISDGTVKLHVKAILRKLGVHSRVEAAVIAVEQGLRSSRDGAA